MKTVLIFAEHFPRDFSACKTFESFAQSKRAVHRSAPPLSKQEPNMFKGRWLCGQAEFDVRKVHEQVESFHGNRCRKVSGTDSLRMVGFLKEDSIYCSREKIESTPMPRPSSIGNPPSALSFVLNAEARLRQKRFKEIPSRSLLGSSTKTQAVILSEQAAVRKGCGQRRQVLDTGRPIGACSRMDVS
jgi:hypothetical protein